MSSDSYSLLLQKASHSSSTSFISMDFTWHTLPNELKLAVMDNLDPNTTKIFSQVDMQTYSLSIPVLFRSVKLDDLGKLLRFLDNVPRTYCHHIRELDLCTRSQTSTDNQSASQFPRAASDAVLSLLIASSRLIKLTFRMAGSLDKSVIMPFAYLKELKILTIANCSEEEHSPLSERLVVSIAATTPNLEQLSLDRITRSKLHASELEGTYPFIPLVTGDDDVPNHPILGSDLSLPSLLRIPSLKKLTIRDSHLGDTRWATVPVACHLEVLDLGTCYHESEEFNAVCTQRIMTAVGPTVDEFSLTTSVSDTVFATSTATPLPRLRKLHISPFFPVDSVVDTMSNLAGSPIESLSMQCYEDDVVDVCSALEDFLSLRVERGPDFYKNLARIDVAVSENDTLPFDADEVEERLEATKRLQNFCRDLHLSSVVSKATPLTLGPSPQDITRSSSVNISSDVKVPQRANTL